MDFYDRIGPVALGSRLRRLSERMGEEAAYLYEIYGSGIQPRWFPVARTLLDAGDSTISEIAESIGQTHVSVSQVVSGMRKKGFVTCERGKDDARKTVVTLSDLGKDAMRRMELQCLDVSQAATDLLSESAHDLWSALSDLENALERKSLVQRTKTHRKARELAKVSIVDFQPRYADAFRTLNEEWIRQFFALEAADLAQISNPQTSIISKGGQILFALSDGQPVGVVALIPHGNECLEMAKMAVSQSMQGLGIGKLLGHAAIEKAKEMGARRLYLESNDSLQPALTLYRKLGFVDVEAAEPSPYDRANVFMELRL